MSRPGFLPTPVAPLFAISLGLGLYFLFIQGYLNDRLTFVSLTVLLLVYLWIEVVNVRRVHPDRWLLNPVVFGSFVTFVMAYGLSNVLFFVPPDQLELLGLVPDITPAMVKLMWLVLIAAIAMWAGYWSPIAAHVSRPAAAARFQARFLPRSPRLRPLALFLLVAIATGVRLLQIKLGVFGYSSTYERLIELGSITQYLSLAAGLGKLALVLAALQFYSNRGGSRASPWFYGILALEILWGFLSGFKGAVVIPVLIASISQYLITGRFSKKWIAFILVGIMAAYAVIEPFRAARNEDAAFRGTSLVSILTTLSSASESRATAVESAPILLSILSRLNLSYIGSFGVDYADEQYLSTTGDPEFLADIILAPAHAWIPRLLWDSKPHGTLGLWYNQVVMGMSHFSSTAMGPVTYLYFAGGAIAVFMGFFFIGIVQRALFFLLQPWLFLPGAVVFLAIFQAIIVIDSAFNGILITLFRELPLLLVLQFLIFAKAWRRRTVAWQFEGDRSGRAS